MKVNNTTFFCLGHKIILINVLNFSYVCAALFLLLYTGLCTLFELDDFLVTLSWN